jgi:Uncharacterized protein conserved in bacteria C-term(DUF2220)
MIDTDGALPDVAGALLHTLLDRFEQPGRQRVVRVRLNEAEHPSYFSAEESAPRQLANAALRRLADQGVVRLRWRRWEEGNWLEAVDLVPARAAELYMALGRTPRVDQEHALRQLLANQTPQSGWHADFLQWAAEQIERHRAAPPLDRSDPAGSADVLRALATIAGLKASTLERMLSVQLFGNSKRLEELRGGILQVLRRHDSDAAAFADDDGALLRAHHLDRAPEYVPIAGSLVLELPAIGPFVSARAGDQRPTAHVQPPRQRSAVDLAPFVPSVALSAAMLRQARVIGCEAQALITVENATSFSELAARRTADLLVIYTGGFASPTVIRLLHALRELNPALPLFHWGDLDAGGLRILAHLRSQLGDSVPLAMDPAAFHAHRGQAQPLTTIDRTALTKLATHPRLTDCAQLIATLLKTDQKLEQEAISAEDLLEALRQAIQKMRR